MDKYLILVLNLAHPVKEFVPFLQTDEDDNTIVFDTISEAVNYCVEHSGAPFAMGVIQVKDIVFNV